MTLRLDESRPPYWLFSGAFADEISKLIADARVPLSVAMIMEKRLQTRSALPDIKATYIDHYFDTGDAIAYHPDGRLKVGLDSRYLRELNPSSRIDGGALIITHEQYDSIQGEEFRVSDLEGHVINNLSPFRTNYTPASLGTVTKEQVKSNPLWRALARDQILLNDYVEMAFEGVMERFNGTGKDGAMRIYIRPCGGENPEIRALCIEGLHNRYNLSGTDSLRHPNSRLVGIVKKHHPIEERHLNK